MRRLERVEEREEEPVVTFRPFTPSETEGLRPRDGRISMCSTIKADSPSVTTPPDLRSQLKSLRDQQRLTEEVHSLQMDRLREDYENRLAQHLAASEDLFHQLEASELALKEEQARSQRLQGEMQALKSTQQREVNDLQEIMQGLRREIGALQASQRSAFAGEISSVQIQAQSRYEALEQDYLQVKSHREEALSALRTSESESKKLKKILNDLRTESDSEIRHLQEQLMSLRREIRGKGQEVEDLKRFHQRQEVHSDVRARETTALELESASLRARNAELETQVARLEKLVFGKPSRRL